MNKKTIFNLVISGLLMGMAILLGALAWFPLFGGNVYLVGIVIFALPIFLPFGYAMMTGLTSIFIVDLITGWVQYSWISLLAYGVSILIIWFFIQIRLKIAYIIGVLLAILVNLTIYYVLILATIDHAYAIATLISTSIQFAIIFPISSLLYYPFKIIQKTLPNKKS